LPGRCGIAKREYSEVEIIGALKQLEAGGTAAEIGRELGVSKHTIYACKAKYGGMSVGEAQRLRQFNEVTEVRCPAASSI